MARLVENPLTPFAVSVPLFAAGASIAAATGALTIPIIAAAAIGTGIALAAQLSSTLICKNVARYDRIIPNDKMILRVALTALVYAVWTAAALAAIHLAGFPVSLTTILLAILSGTALGALINIPQHSAMRRNEQNRHLRALAELDVRDPYWRVQEPRQGVAPEGMDQLFMAQGNDPNQYPINRVMQTRDAKFAAVVQTSANTDASQGDYQATFISERSDAQAVHNLKWAVCDAVTRRPSTPLGNFTVVLIAIERVGVFNNRFNVVKNVYRWNQPADSTTLKDVNSARVQEEINQNPISNVSKRALLIAVCNLIHAPLPPQPV